MAGSPSSRKGSSCWCTPDMWTMCPGSGRLTTSWPIEKMPRGSTWNAAQNQCETMSSACRTWSNACMSSIPSRSTRPHPPSPPYSQPCLHLVNSLRTLTQPVLRGRKHWPVSCESGCSVRMPPSMHPFICANDWRLPRNQAKKPAEELTTRAAEIERTALKAVINLVEVSQLVDLPQFLEHRGVEECMVSVWSYSTPTAHTERRKTASSLRSSLCNM